MCKIIFTVILSLFVIFGFGQTRSQFIDHCVAHHQSSTCPKRCTISTDRNCLDNCKKEFKKTCANQYNKKGELGDKTKDCIATKVKGECAKLCGNNKDRNCLPRCRAQAEKSCRG